MLSNTSRVDFPSLVGISPIKPPFVLLDFEYTSFSHEHGRIIMAGLGLVMDGVEPTYEDFILRTPYDPWIWGSPSRRSDFIQVLQENQIDHYEVQMWADANGGSVLNCPHIPQEVWDRRDAKGKRVFECGYDIHRIHPDRTVKEGMERGDTLLKLRSILTTAASKGWPVVGHNIYQADLPLLQRELFREGIGELPIDYDLVLDTGLLCKAVQCQLRLDGPRQAFYHRMAHNRRRGVNWSLQRYCVPTYDLASRGVDSTRQHTSAAYDCFVVHKLMEAVGLIG